ncbi:MAG: hypothetical protein WB566_09425, partial [Terriglobales bacterium]
VANKDALLPQVGIDREALATVVWVGPKGVEAATGSTGRTGRFRVTSVAPGSDIGFVRVSVNPQGDAFAVWSDGHSLFTSSRRGAGAGWCQRTDLGLGGLAQIAPAKNTGMIVWQVPTEHPPSSYIAARRVTACRDHHN